MIYVASRVHHAPMWRELRTTYPIRASWLDEAGPGESPSLTMLWDRNIDEVRTASAMVLYALAADFPLKGTLVEAGAACAGEVPIFVAMPDVVLEPGSDRPIGSWVRRRNVLICRTLDDALSCAVSAHRSATGWASPGSW